MIQTTPQHSKKSRPLAATATLTPSQQVPALSTKAAHAYNLRIKLRSCRRRSIAAEAAGLAGECQDLRAPTLKPTLPPVVLADANSSSGSRCQSDRPEVNKVGGGGGSLQPTLRRRHTYMSTLHHWKLPSIRLAPVTTERGARGYQLFPKLKRGARASFTTDTDNGVTVPLPTSSARSSFDKLEFSDSSDDDDAGSLVTSRQSSLTSVDKQRNASRISDVHGTGSETAGIQMTRRKSCVSFASELPAIPPSTASRKSVDESITAASWERIRGSSPKKKMPPHRSATADRIRLENGRETWPHPQPWEAIQDPREVCVAQR